MNNSWVTNAMTSQRTTWGGIMLAIGTALLGASTLGIEVPNWLKIVALVLGSAGPVIMGTQARQGNVSSEEVAAAADRAKGGSGYPPTTLGLIAFILIAGAVFSGCAFTRQRVTTMDGDTFSQVAGSTLGKQDSTQKVDADFYPNNSGSHISVGGASTQDTTALVPIIAAVVSALQREQSAAPAAAGPGRLEQLETEITRLRGLVRAFNPDAVVKVAP